MAVDGQRIGVVLATFNSSFGNFALNKGEFDDLLAAKRDGRLDAAFVVATKNNGSSNPLIYCDEIDATELESRLKSISPREGAYGDFYALPDDVFPALAELPF
jgi:hypothetical protein